MNWRNFWERHGDNSDPLIQVGRRGGLEQQSDAFLKAYAQYIASILQLTPNDVLLDVCCGNGMLTQYLSSHCKHTIGVDFSERHIQFAQSYFSAANLEFIAADALNLQELSLQHPITKASLCFSFQYFESVPNGLKVIEGMLNHGATQILLTDIPDRTFFFTYYSTFPKLIRLAKQMLLQQNDMGKFWSVDELNWIAARLGLQGVKHTQPAHFPYAHYRMDYVFTKV